MKSVVVKHRYGLENITIEEQAIPTIKSHEVLVKVNAIALNQLDLMIAKGTFGTILPHVLGSDAAGIVEQVGHDVTLFKKGDAVVTHFIQSWQSGTLKQSDLQSRLGTDVQGVFSEYVALPQDSLLKIPSNLTIEQAATLPIAALTAWEALVNVGKLQPNQTVLLQGTGGVSIFALQFAKALGAKVIITSGSDEKLAQARLLGADEIINYQIHPNWQNKVLELTHGEGVDLALEMSWADVDKTIQAMKLTGKIAVIGLLGGADAYISVFGIMQKSLSIHGVQVGSKASFTTMNEFIESKNLKPVIDQIFKVSDITKALKYFDGGQQLGKVVLTF